MKTNNMKTITLSLLAFGGMLLAGLCNPARAAEPGDGFDGLYGKRIELFASQLAIYESVVNQANAAEAAKKWRALLPLEKEIKQLTEKLGQPEAERQAELNRKYGEQLNGLSSRTLRAGYGVAGKPYGKALHIAQLENRAAVEDSDEIRQALAILKGDPKAMAVLEAERKAAAEKLAALKTDPAIDQAFKAYLATTRELAVLLDGVKDIAGANEAGPKALELVKKWESEAKALKAFGPAAANTTQKLNGEMKADMGSLVMTVIKLNGNKALSEPLKDVLHRIMKAFADV